MPGLLRSVLCVLCLSYFLGCLGGEVVRIKVGVDSEVDMRKYDTIAVMDFIDDRSSSLTDQGKILARMVRKQLGSSKGLHVMDERTMHLNLDQEIDKNKINDPAALISMSSQLGADALIVGTFDFREVNQPMPYIVERYSPTTGRYTPETRTYVRRSHRLSFHMRVVDGETGETIFDYTPRVMDRQESRRSTVGLPLSGSGRSEPTSLQGMAAIPVATFVLSLVPHYEYEKRILAR
ncbi:hypothetical protein ACFL6S_04790 [Candidatus Poribacteria bacterium]